MDPLSITSHTTRSRPGPLQREYGYKPYPYKHYESIFGFYQGYILPKKFGYDKRKFISTLIMVVINQVEAMKLLEDPPTLIQAGRARSLLVIKRLGSEEDFNRYICGRYCIKNTGRKIVWDACARVYKLITFRI